MARLADVEKLSADFREAGFAPVEATPYVHTQASKQSQMRARRSYAFTLRNVRLTAVSQPCNVNTWSASSRRFCDGAQGSNALRLVPAIPSP